MLGKKGAAKGGQTNSKDVLSATELGLKAKSLGIMKKPMTQKGKKILLHKAPKIEENEKTSIFIKGNKASQNMQDLMKDLHSMRDPALSKLFLRKAHDWHPFEDIGPVEHMAVKQDASLFLFSSHQKKRADNLVFGRMYAEHILDLFEFGMSDFKGICAFKSLEVDN